MMPAQELMPGYPLRDLLTGLLEQPPTEEIFVTGLATHSGRVKKGDLFIAPAAGGPAAIAYIQEAIRAGAGAVLAEAGSLPSSCTIPAPVYLLKDLRRQTGIIADRFFRHPSAALTVIGVTGTNGKTTVSHLLAQALTRTGRSACGMIGTLGYGTYGNLAPGPNTTPETVVLHGLLAQMRDQNLRHVVMEVSSHGLEQHRTAGVEFDLALLTNLSHDHLDYHQSLENYAAAKRCLFTDYPIRQAVVNMDDAFGRSLLSLPRVETFGYTLQQRADLPGLDGIISGSITLSDARTMIIEVDSPWGQTTLRSRLPGNHNAANLLASLSALCALGQPLADVTAQLAECRLPPGRMEYFGGGGRPQVVVDYAHTPDALEQVLAGLRTICRGKLHCVFGCGGERDQDKRPVMGAVAERYADDIVITSDNPRAEDPAQIIRDILSGISDRGRVTVEPDRARAIAGVIRAAGVDDVALIAGKGHEDYQEIAGRRLPFSDQAVVRKVLEEDA